MSDCIDQNEQCSIDQNEQCNIYNTTLSKYTTLSIGERDQKFKDDLRAYKDEYGLDTLNAFYEYWSEKNSKGTKMRFENEKTWELGKRLSRWKTLETKRKL